ncbi:MAG: TetR/AcrR family transcriptional regulator [Clostridiales bacterium]|nr:TetR/AcrR family transcriptional regulator [Clostridiales bacterium]
MSEEKKAAVARYHRKALMEVADRLLTELGYDGMNMNLLAKEAKYSKATVYVYFSSKDEIVRRLCIDRLDLFRREIGVILKNDAGLDEKLAAVRYALDEFAQEDGVYFDFICASAFCSPVSDGTDSEKQLSALVLGILNDLTALMPEAELKKAWYAYYGEYKTAKMFTDGEK